MPRSSSTLIYLVVFLGLICFLFIDKKNPGTKEREEADTQLFKLNPDDVTKLEISNAHGFFYFEKIGSHWEIRKPVNTPADGASVDGVINQIAFAQPQRVIPVDGSSDKDIANLKEWGLIPAAERVVIHTPDKQYELLVGRKVAINDSAYARASGRKNESVRIIPGTVKDALQKDLSDFRSRSVFDFDADKVVRVASHVADTSTTPGQQCEIDLKDGAWTMQMPLVARASTPDVQALLTKILAQRAVDFTTDDASNLSTYGLTSPTATISVALKGDGNKTGDEMVLQIGGAVPGKPDQVYAQRLKSSSVFTLARSAVDDLLRTLPNVRDKRVLPFDSARATGLTFSLGPKNGQVRFEHGLWNCAGPDPGLADLNKVTDLLTELSQLETTPALKDSAPDLKPFGLDKPLGKITIQSPEFKPGPTLTLLIGKTENKVTYVRNSTEPFIYTLPDNALDILPANNLALRDARVINLRLDQVTGMTITAGTGPSITLTRSPGGTWSATNVKDRMVDSTMADRQASLLCQLQAQSWLGPVLPTYALSKPVLTIKIQADQPAPTVLRIGGPLPDGTHAAQVDGQPSAFALADGDYGILNASSLQLLPAALAPTNAPAAQAPGTNPSTNAPAAKH